MASLVRLQALSFLVESGKFCNLPWGTSDGGGGAAAAVPFGLRFAGTGTRHSSAQRQLQVLRRALSSRLRHVLNFSSGSH